MGRPPLLADVVPRRNGTFFIILAGGAAIILMLGVLYAVGIRLAPLTSDGHVAAFDLDSEGSIGSWFSIVLLFVCGQATLVVRRLRVAAGCARRESREWFAVALVWFTMSLDEGASLHEGFKEMMARLVGSRILGDGSIYWIVPYFVALSASGLFLLVAARRTPAAVVFLLAAGASYAVAVVMQLGVVFPTRPMLATWIEESCEMLGDLLILMTLGLHARSVVAMMEQTGHSVAGRGSAASIDAVRRGTESHDDRTEILSAA